MRSTFLSRSRKWIGASALAILVGMSGGSAFFAASSQLATAQVTQAAQINIPAVNEPTGFADLVAAVKPAVVSIVVEAQEQRSSAGSILERTADLHEVAGIARRAARQHRRERRQRDVAERSRARDRDGDEPGLLGVAQRRLQQV